MPEELTRQEIGLLRRAEALGLLGPAGQQAMEALRLEGKLTFAEPRIPAGGRKSFAEPLRRAGVALPEPSPAERRALIEAGGGVVGGLLGPQGAGFGALAGRAAASAVGGGLGSLAAENAAPSDRPFREAGIAGGFQAGGEFAGAAGGAVLGRFFRPFKAPLAKGAAAALRIARQAGTTLPVGTAQVGGAASVLQNLVEGSFFGSGVVRGRITEVEDLVRAEVERFANATGKLSREEAGQALQQMIERSADVFRMEGRKIYQFVDQQLAKELTARGFDLSSSTVRFVDTGGLKKLAGEVEKKFIFRRTGRKVKDLVDDIKDLDNRVTFETAAQLRSELLAASRAQPADELIRGQTASVATRFIKEANSALNDAGKQLGGDALRAFRDANKFWAEGAADFNNRVVTSLLQKDPELALDTLLQNRKVTQIRRVRNMALKSGGTRAWQALQQNFMFKVIDRSTDRAAGQAADQLSGAKMLRVLQQFSDESLRELMPNSQMRRGFTELAEALTASQRAAAIPGTPGRVFMQLTQARGSTELILGAGTALVGGDFGTIDIGTGSLIVAGPGALGAILSSPRLSRWLIEGTTLPAGTRGSITALTKLGAALNRPEAQNLFRQIVPESQQSEQAPSP